MKSGPEGFLSDQKPQLEDTQFSEQTNSEEPALFDHETRTFEGIDFSTSLGKDFNSEFFEGKLEMYSTKEYVDSWNDFIALGHEDLDVLKVEHDWLYALFTKLSGYDSAKMMFPVFIQSLQSHCKNKNLPVELVTPERMQQFYDYMQRGRSV